MIKISDLPAVRAQIEQDVAAAKKEPAPRAQAATVEYARAPQAGATATTPGRPPAIQRNSR